MEAYPVTDQRRDRFAEVMTGLREYSAEELDGEFSICVPRSAEAAGPECRSFRPSCGQPLSRGSGLTHPSR